MPNIEAINTQKKDVQETPSNPSDTINSWITRLHQKITPEERNLGEEYLTAIAQRTLGSFQIREGLDYGARGTIQIALTNNGKLMLQSWENQVVIEFRKDGKEGRYTLKVGANRFPVNSFEDALKILHLQNSLLYSIGENYPKIPAGERGGSKVMVIGKQIVYKSKSVTFPLYDGVGGFISLPLAQEIVRSLNVTVHNRATMRWNYI